MAAERSEFERHGFLAPCPSCGTREFIRAYLYDLGGFHCESCDTHFDIETIRAFVAAWWPLLAFIDTAPRIDPDSTDVAPNAPGREALIPYPGSRTERRPEGPFEGVA